MTCVFVVGFTITAVKHVYVMLLLSRVIVSRSESILNEAALECWKSDGGITLRAVGGWFEHVMARTAGETFLRCLAGCENMICDICLNDVARTGWDKIDEVISQFMSAFHRQGGWLSQGMLNTEWAANCEQSCFKVLQHITNVVIHDTYPSHANRIQQADTLNILPLVEQVQSGPSFDHRPIAVLIVVTSTQTIPCFAANVENRVLRPGRLQKHDPKTGKKTEFVRKFFGR